jgi:hypothetical protein
MTQSKEKTEAPKKKTEVGEEMIQKEKEKEKEEKGVITKLDKIRGDDQQIGKSKINEQAKYLINNFDESRRQDMIDSYYNKLLQESNFEEKKEIGAEDLKKKRSRMNLGWKRQIERIIVNSQNIHSELDKLARK